MQKPTAGPIAVPHRPRRLQLVYSAGVALEPSCGPGAPIRLGGRAASPFEVPCPHWDARLQPIIRRVIRAMSEAHPSTLMEELLGPLRCLHIDDLPDNADALARRLAEELNEALPLVVADRADIGKAALGWLARMELNAREPARRQYRELLSLLG